MNHYEKMRNLVSELENDLIKFYEKGNMAAGTRARVALQEIKVLVQDMRKDIQNIKTANSNSSSKDKSSNSKKK